MALFDESESILCKQFFFNFNFDLGVLAQKCLKLCANGVLKIQFFFLNLSSKVLAGVRVRMSKYPYMDICVMFLFIRSVALHVCLLVANCADERGQTDRQKYIQTDRQTDRQRDIQTDRQTD